ncbi:hypothetical protein C7999DRAFT_42571 [Corynascus novoguineensis]|uniref:DUF7600 domain-containing protein n=1 Tax=Corynascus novoguineensis TaxID=1126955 RepID=A0AAN7HLL9_9PEZI|nr:hypothetical protein C7999DRAFT_42571 [Corynascus novoguineensis]
MNTFLVRCTLCGRVVLADWGSDAASPSSERHGIVFHDVCWSLLETALQPASVSLQCLFDFCSSLAIPRNCRAPTWGHGFGGVVVVDKNVHFPWEDRYKVPESTKPDPVFSKNPYQVPGIARLLAENLQQPTMATRPARPSQALPLDCFASLPGERCVVIAILLPTADCQQFWASRFKPPLPAANRSWLFETRYFQSPIDWRWLYRRTNDGLIEQIVDILALFWNKLPASLPETWSLHSTLLQKPGDHQFHNGCRLFRTQSIAIPDDLAHLFIYTATFGDGHIRLGYSSRSKHLIKLTQIWGFRGAIGSRGLQALQCITGPTGSESPWIGFPDDVPRTERLVLTDRVVGLEVGFDGCKIARLAVRSRSPPSRHYSGLRHSAVWYPTVPPQNLCLNEESFISRDIWAGGKSIRHLTGISAIYCLGILRIHFSFGIEVPWEHRSFGRLKLEEGYENSADFSIDGPGGERIRALVQNPQDQAQKAQG